MPDYKTVAAEALYEEQLEIYLAESEAILIRQGWGRDAARARAREQYEAEQEGHSDITGALGTLREADELAMPIDSKALVQVKAIQRDLLKRRA